MATPPPTSKEPPALTGTLALAATCWTAPPATGATTERPGSCPASEVCLYDGNNHRSLLLHTTEWRQASVGAANDRADSLFNDTRYTIRFYEHGLGKGDWVCVGPHTGILALSTYGMGNRITSYFEGGRCGTGG